MRAASCALGTASGGRPDVAKGVRAVGDGGEMRTTSRLQLCRRSPEDGLCARSGRSAQSQHGLSTGQHCVTQVV